MEVGAYQHGRYTWNAGTFDAPPGCSDPCSVGWPITFPAAPGVLATINDTNNSGATWIRHHEVTRAALNWRWDSSNSEKVHWVAFTEN